MLVTLLMKCHLDEVSPRTRRVSAEAPCSKSDPGQARRFSSVATISLLRHSRLTPVPALHAPTRLALPFLELQISLP